MSTVNIFDMADTWNDEGVNFTAIKMNVDNQNSGSGSQLIDLQLDGETVFRVRKDGRTFAESFAVSGEVGAHVNSDGVYIGRNNGLRFSNNIAPLSSTDVVLRRDLEPGALGQRDGVTPQAFRVYNTYTDSSNHERAVFGWSSNSLRIGTERAGTGSNRPIQIRTDGALRMTIGESGNVFFYTAIKAQSSPATHEINASDGGTSHVALRLSRYGSGNDNGAVIDVAHLGGTVASPTAPSAGVNINSLAFRAGGTLATLASNPSFMIRHTIGSTIGSSMVAVDTAFVATATSTGIPLPALTIFGQSSWVQIHRGMNVGESGAAFALTADGSQVAAFRNGVNPQTVRVYNTYTDGSNYERGFARWSSNVFEIGTEAAGTGVLRDLRLMAGNSTATLKASSEFVTSATISSMTGVFRNGNSGNKLVLTNTQGVATLYNHLETDFNRLQFGGTSAAFPALKRVGTNLAVRLADDSNPTDIELGFNILFGTNSTHPRLRANGTVLDVVDRNATGYSTMRVGALWLNSDTQLWRDNADQLALRRNTSPQTFRVYNTYTDASNYERGFARWASNTFQIGTERAGTGVARPLSFWTNGLSRMNIGADGGLVYTLESSSQPGEIAAQLELFESDDAGSFTLTCYDFSLGAYDPASFSMVPGSGITINCSDAIELNTGHLNMNRFGNGIIFEPETQTFFPISNAGSVGVPLNRFTNANIDNLYLHNTYANPSNYERGFVRWVSNAFEIATERLGTGAARPIIFRTNTANRFMIGATGTITATLAANQNFIISGLPTANPNVAGALWNDGGTLKVSAG